MRINPFGVKDDGNEKTSINQSKNKQKIEVQEMVAYLIENFLELLKKEDKLLLGKEIEKYIYEHDTIIENAQIEEMKQTVFHHIFGYGILEKYIQDIEISDIRVVSYQNVYIKRNGVWSKVEEQFESEKAFIEYIQYCMLKNNGTINYENPLSIVSDKKYNLRIEAGISPINAISPSLVIRIHHLEQEKSLEVLAFGYNMMDLAIYEFLHYIMIKGKNLVIAGKGGSGKTTLLRALVSTIPKEKAISVSEETTELYVKDRNVIEREVFKDQIDLEELLKHSLVTSNDIIVIRRNQRKRKSGFPRWDFNGAHWNGNCSCK